MDGKEGVMVKKGWESGVKVMVPYQRYSNFINYVKIFIRAIK